MALVFAVSAVLAVAVGILLRQTAAAVALLLVWALVVENVLAFLPRIGDDIGRWLPFFNAGNFLAAGDDVASGAAFGFAVDHPFEPWGAWATSWPSRSGCSRCHSSSPTSETHRRYCVYAIRPEGQMIGDRHG